MRNFWLRAAFVASLLRDVLLGCAVAGSWPFRFAARKADDLARLCSARARDCSGKRAPVAPSPLHWQSMTPDERAEFLKAGHQLKSFRDLLRRTVVSGDAGEAKASDAPDSGARSCSH